MDEPLIVIEHPLSDESTPDAVWDSEMQTIHRLEYSEHLKFCKRCETKQPIDNFVRRISINKALSLARASAARKGVSGEPIKAEAYHRNMTAIHAMCNTCAVKRRAKLKTLSTAHTTTVKQLTAEAYDMELQLDGRYERLTPNPFGTHPQFLTLREVMVAEYQEVMNARRADATRKAKKANAAPAYKEFTKEIYNEMQRIKMLCKAQRNAYHEVVQDFCKYYLLHLEQTRETIRKERYSANPVKPKANVFKYIDYDSAATRQARLHLRNLSSLDLERVKPKLLPTADLYD